MPEKFEEFLKPLKATHFSLSDFVDFPKVVANVKDFALKLNQLNYLIGQEDMEDAVRLIWKENPKAFSVLGILIAVRPRSDKKVIDKDGNEHALSDYFKSPEQIMTFLNETGLTKILRDRKIKNLVDYVFGIEVGLDTNARKNRGGHIMEGIVANLFRSHEIAFEQEVYSTEFPEIAEALGADNKRFDFVIRTPKKIYLIEANFYTDGGSKLNEVARSYSELAPKINAVPGYEFVWITDGLGWNAAHNKLEEAFRYVQSVYNLTSISDFIRKIK